MVTEEDTVGVMPSNASPNDAITAAGHDDVLDEDAEHGQSDVQQEPHRKRRKIIPIQDKKFECPHPDCDKKYSRAEHLYRHQLNRA